MTKLLNLAFLLLAALIVVGVFVEEEIDAPTYLQDKCAVLPTNAPIDASTDTKMVSLDTFSSTASSFTKLSPTVSHLKAICAGGNKFLTPQIIINKANFWKWLCKMPPSEIQCNIKYINQHSLYECYQWQQSTLVVELPGNFVFIGCVHDKSGIVRPHKWDFPITDAVPSSYKEGELMRVAHMFNYNKSWRSQPFCGNSRLLYLGVNITTQMGKDNHTKIESATACWCKGEMCAYQLFDSAGFYPEPYMHDMPLNETLYTRKYVNTESHTWQITGICVLFTIFMVFATHHCYKLGQQEADHRYGHMFEPLPTTSVQNRVEEGKSVPNRNGGGNSSAGNTPIGLTNSNY